MSLELAPHSCWSKRTKGQRCRVYGPQSLTINILTASRLLSKPSHQLIMCELDKCIILLCWKNKHLLVLATDLNYKLLAVIFKVVPASFVVSISSYSSRILSSRSFNSLSHIIPTCLRENKGCSFLAGDEAPEDMPVRIVKTPQLIQDKCL